MSNDPLNERLLVRRLAGELSAAEALRVERRLVEDPKLQARYARLRTTWEGLELEDAPGVPEGFRDGVMAAARQLADGDISWSAAPAWARAGAAAALLLGLAVGAGFGVLPAPRAAAGPANAELDAYLAAELDAQPMSLAEAYWIDLEESDDPFAGGEAP